jgi:hypothetical protein
LKQELQNIGHWSDCAVYNAPACLPGPCNCGGLDLAAYERYRLVTALIPSSGSLARFISDGVLPSAVQAEQPPANGVPALAAAPDLVSPHDGVALGRGSNCVDLNNASVTPVSDREAFPSAQSITSNVPPHIDPPDSVSGDRSTAKGRTNG